MLTVTTRGRQVFPWVRLASRCSWTDPESGAAFSSAMNDAPCFQLLRGGGAYSRPRDTYRLHPLPLHPLPPAGGAGRPSYLAATREFLYPSSRPLHASCHHHATPTTSVDDATTTATSIPSLHPNLWSLDVATSLRGYADLSLLDPAPFGSTRF